MKITETYPRLRVVVTVALAAAALSGCLHEVDTISTCGTNATDVEPFFTSTQSGYSAERDPSILEPLWADKAAEHSTLFDDVTVGMGQIVCLKNGKEVLTKQAVVLGNSLKGSDLANSSQDNRSN